MSERACRICGETEPSNLNANAPTNSLLALDSKARALLLTAEKDCDGAPLDPDDPGWALSDDAVRRIAQCTLT